METIQLWFKYRSNEGFKCCLPLTVFKDKVHILVLESVNSYYGHVIVWFRTTTLRQ